MSAATMNGASVIARAAGGIYVRIPRELAADIDTGCSCDFCKAHPELVPKWDTLLIPAEESKNGNDYVSTVHMPEPRNFRLAMAAKDKLAGNGGAK